MKAFAGPSAVINFFLMTFNKYNSYCFTPEAGNRLQAVDQNNPTQCRVGVLGNMTMAKAWGKTPSYLEVLAPLPLLFLVPLLPSSGVGTASSW